MRLLVLGALCVATACGGAEGGGGSTSDPPLDPRIEVAVDPRVELLSIVFGLAGSPEYAEAYPSPWRDAVDEQFAPLRDREGAPVDLSLATVADFADEGGFDRVHAEYASHRGEVEERLGAAIAGQPLIDSFETLFGPRPGTRFRFVPGLLTGPYNYSASAVAPDGSSVFVQVIGTEFPAAQTLELAVHEMAHAYVNPILDAQAEALAAVSGPAFASVEPQMRAQHSTDAPTMVNELMVRAVTIVYVRDNVDDRRAAAMILEEKDRGFRWIGPLVTRLDDLREQSRGAPIAEDALVEAVRGVLQ